VIVFRPPRRIALPLVAALLLGIPAVARACEGMVAACAESAEGSFELIAEGRAVHVTVAADSPPAVRHAAHNFGQDLKVVASIDTKVIKSTDHGTTVKKGH
jgi:hypothetical protein